MPDLRSIEVFQDDQHENEYDVWAARQYAGRRIDRPERRTWSCPNYNAPYCMDHDYDHVLERREEQDTFNARWAEMKNEAARQEREQEAAAFLADPY